ncbi:MAG: adenylate cyclase [Acidobacteria bacterium]|nr:MAG: adenylate cyclase [Acidobacteriota bacterium]
MERERKFLVKRRPEGISQFEHSKIDQGYLARSRDEVEIRIRKNDDDYTLTVKKGTGDERIENEIAITRRDFKKLWPLTKGKRVKKTRYRIPYQKYRIELDIYEGSLKGLKTAEVEFRNRKDETIFSPPRWMDTEITGTKKYRNWNLATTGRKRRKNSDG